MTTTIKIYEKNYDDFNLKNKLLKDVKKLSSSCLKTFVSKKTNKEYEVGVREEYVTDVLSCCTDIIFVAYHDKKPASFILAKLKKNNLYISILCSDVKGYGSIILKEFLKYADDYKINVSLSSLVTVLKYYPKFDFEFRKSCGVNQKDYFQNQTLLKKVFDTQVDIDLDTMKDKSLPFADFLFELDKEGFLSYPGNNKSLCEHYKSNDKKLSCFAQQDGFTMFRCKFNTKESEKNLKKLN